jgi:hypothetical protein
LKKKELVYKPNQTIMITNREITATQRKAYNIILFEAQNELKNNPNQVLFNFEISKLKQRAGIKASDNWHLKKDIKKLRNIEVEVVKDNGDWSIFGLISYDFYVDEFITSDDEWGRCFFLTNTYHLHARFSQSCSQSSKITIAGH